MGALAGALHSKSQNHSIAVLTLVCVGAALVLGGGTRAGFAGDVALQYLSVPLLALAVPRLFELPEKRQLRTAVLFCGLLLLLPALQLSPLPSGLRSHLPGAAQIAGSYALFDQPAPAWPLSMTPHATWQALLGLLPPVAAFFGMLTLNLGQRRRICLLLVSIAALSVFLGLGQLSQGQKSNLRFYEFTNVDDAVGFFANRNHYSAFLYVAMLFSGCWVIEAFANGSGESLGRKHVRSSHVLKIAGSLTVFAILVMAQAMTRSRGGVALSVVALSGVLAMAVTVGRSRFSNFSLTKLIGGAIAFAILFSLQFSLFRLIARFDTDSLADTRAQFMRTTLGAAASFLPFGSGAGSFVYVYPGFEKRSEVEPFFANHAHNDIAEAALEVGIPAVILMALFTVWLVRVSLQIWRELPDHDDKQFDLAIRRAATISLLLLILHSFVDYPLHTTAMATVAAICCGLLLPAPHGAHHHPAESNFPAQGPSAAPSRQRQGRPPPVRSGQAFQAEQPPDSPSAPRPHERWNAPQGEWPSEWTSAPKPQQHGRPAPPSAPPAGAKDEDEPV